MQIKCHTLVNNHWHVNTTQYFPATSCAVTKTRHRYSSSSSSSSSSWRRRKQAISGLYIREIHFEYNFKLHTIILKYYYSGGEHGMTIYTIRQTLCNSVSVSLWQSIRYSIVDSSSSRDCRSDASTIFGSSTHRYRRRYFKYRKYQNTDKWIPKIPKIRFGIHLLELWAVLPLKLDTLISLTDIWSCRVLHPNCKCVFAGDFNVNLDGSN